MSTFGRLTFPVTGDAPGGREWRHLEGALRSDQFPHAGSPAPTLQVLSGHHFVKILRGKGIKCRLGGSVAALGYMSTRQPDDIDIDILPANANVDLAELELQQAMLHIETLTGSCFRVGDSGTQQFTWANVAIMAVTRQPSSKFVKALEVKVEARRNYHNQVTYEVSTLHQSTSVLKVQLINETAFTYMNWVKDAGTVPVEVYKEVAGFSRLVANSLGRLLQNAPNDPKNDRDRIRQMLVSKVPKYATDLNLFTTRLSKILDYFILDTVNQNYQDMDRYTRAAANVLGDLVSELVPNPNPHQTTAQFAHFVADQIFNVYIMKRVARTLQNLKGILPPPVIVTQVPQ